MAKSGATPTYVFGNMKTYQPRPGGLDFAEGGFGLAPTHGYGTGKNPYIQPGVFTGQRNPSGSAGFWIEQNPEAYYQLAQSRQGRPTDDETAYGRWLTNQYSGLYKDFTSARGVSPNLSFNKFLAGVLPRQENEYRTRAATLRGEAPSLSGGAQWLAF